MDRKKNYDRQWIAAQRQSLKLSQSDIQKQTPAASSHQSTPNNTWHRLPDLAEWHESSIDMDVDSHDDPIDLVDPIVLTERTSPRGHVSQHTENVSPSTLKEGLANWAVDHNITHSAVDGLLTILKRHNIQQLPSTARTLLGTQQIVPLTTKSGMDYVFLGVQTMLKKTLQKNPLPVDTSVLKLSLNVDGLPLFKSSKTCLWSILAATDQIPPSVFPVALTCGTSKPADLDFLTDTTNELSDLLREGIVYEGRNIAVNLQSIICDAPARAMVKGTKQYSGYYGCDRCTQKGVWLGRITYQEVEGIETRTDQSFRAQTQTEHHQNISPFLTLGIDMVKSFPVDYMHQACLGVMKKLLLTWVSGIRPTRISRGQVMAINNRLLGLREAMPGIFARKPRSLDELDRWKATELRQFMLYTGKIVLKGILREDVYEHFLTFSVALAILVCPSLVKQHHQYAKGLLSHFVHTAKTIYGPEFIVYNVHSMLHLAEDAEAFTGLDKCSAFPFENFNQKLKKRVRSGNRPLPQIVRRLSECNPKFESPSHTQQSFKRPNNIFQVGTVFVEVLEKISQVEVMCRVYNSLEALFVVPCDSRTIGVFCTKRIDTHTQMITISQLEKQAIMIQNKEDSAVFMRILHEI
ncbi:hypothetical protein ACEWY4_003138 [Coilia grayii]|uniref:Transposase n=1 Tax=Coilia grayii TaxID=363190 RepID=A0ABD1KQC5_9TELE